MKRKTTLAEAKAKGWTKEQYIRFAILVPFYTQMEMKRQTELKSAKKRSAHHHYDRAIALILEMEKEWGHDNG